MHIEQVEAKGLAQYSYVLISDGDSVVIDPRRDIDVYVAMICGSGYRSSIAASLLKRAGVSEVVNLAGGMSAYRA